MASLFDKTIESSYNGLLKLIDNIGLTTSFKQVTDADGSTTPFYLKQDGVKIGESEYPTADGSANEFLITDGSGVISFSKIKAVKKIKSSSYTLTNLDWGDIIECDSSGTAFTITLPDSLNENFNCNVVWISATSITFATTGTATTVGKGTDIAEQYGGVFLYNNSSSRFVLIGDLE